MEQIGGTKENLQALSAVLAAGGIGIDGQMGQGAVDMMPTVRSASEAQTVPGGDVEAHVIYPAKHHVIGDGEMETILEAISSEMEERCAEFGKDGMVLEAERLRQRTENDMMLLRAVGTCKVMFFCFSPWFVDCDKVLPWRPGADLFAVLVMLSNVQPKTFCEY